MSLQQNAYLLNQFQQRRKVARAQERRENRQRRPLSQNTKSQLPKPHVEREKDVRALDPQKAAIDAENFTEMKKLLPRLKARDRKRVETFLACDGDRATTAKKLGVSQKVFSRQWRQTTTPNIRRLLRARGGNR